jgi:hypothetical protein
MKTITNTAKIKIHYYDESSEPFLMAVRRMKERLSAMTTKTRVEYLKWVEKNNIILHKKLTSNINV